MAPVLLVQGVRARRSIPRLPDADGPTSGSTGDPAQALRLVVIGESTVAGVGAPDHGSALTGQVARTLAHLTGRPVTWRALGQTGATATDVRASLAPLLAGDRADAVVIALGVNDTKDLRSVARWRRDLTALVVEVRGYVGVDVPVVLGGVPPLHAFPALPPALRGFLGSRAELLDRASRELAASTHGLAHVPTPIEELTETGFASDGFHPSAEGYAIWGRHLAAAVAGLLAGQPDRTTMDGRTSQ